MRMLNISKYNFVFVVTYGRSGSTLLQKVLGDIDGYHISGENNNALYGLYQSFKFANMAKMRFGQEMTKHDNPWYGAELS